MSDETLSASKAGYLMAIRTVPFQPVGWFYRSIYQDLVREGLADHAHFDAYKISLKGKQLLDEFLAIKQAQLEELHHKEDQKAMEERDGKPVVGNEDPHG